jgi:hypothetical protein
MFECEQSYSGAGGIGAHSPIESEIAFEFDEVFTTAGAVWPPIGIAASSAVWFEIGGKLLHYAQQVFVHF